MKKTLYTILLSLVILPSIVYAGVFDFIKTPIFGNGNIYQKEQWTSTTSPSSAITQTVFGKAVRITGLSNGCLGVTSGIVESSGSACGSGSGGSSPPISPTSGAINGSNTSYVFSTEPDVIVADNASYRLNFGFTWNSGTNTATLSVAPTYDIYAYAPVTSSDRDPGVLTVADATSITPSTDLYKIIHQTNTQAAGTLTINADSGTPVDGRGFTLRIESTNAQSLSFNAQYVGGTNPLPTTTSGSGKVDYYSFIYYAADGKYHFTGSALNLG